jgi:type I restriction enzyme M protein
MTNNETGANWQQRMGSLLSWIDADLARASGPKPISIREMVVPASVLLFLRWLDHYESEQAKIAASDGREQKVTLPDELRWKTIRDLRGKHLTRWLQTFTPPEDFAKLQGAGLSRSIGEFVAPEFRVVAEGPYAQHIGNLAYPLVQLQALPEALRDSLVEIISNLPFDTVEERQATEALLAAMIARGGTSGSAFHISPEATDVILELAEPESGERIYDPCFGSGSLLAGVARRLRENAKLLTATGTDGLQDESLFGIEQHPLRYFVGLVRVILAGIDHPGLELDDALTRPKLKNRSREGFDCIIAMPPWRAVVRHSRFHAFEVPTSSIEGLFVQHIVSSLRPGGRAVIALPSSFLSASGLDKRVRRLLLDDFHVEGVIGLPPRLFKPYTAVGSSALVVRRERAAENVKFMRVESIMSADSVPFDPGAISPRQIARRFKFGEPGDDLWFSTSRAIADREWNLNPQPTGQENLQQLLDEITNIDPQLRVVPLGTIAEIVSGVSYRREDTDYGVEYVLENVRVDVQGILGKRALTEERPPMLVRAGDIKDDGTVTPRLTLLNTAVQAKWHSKRLKMGDIVISARGTIGKVGIVGDLVEGHIPSTNVITIRTRTSTAVSQRYLMSLLRAELIRDWLLGHASGSIVKHLTVRALRSLPIPLPILPIQERVASVVVEQNLDALNELARVLRADDSISVSRWLEQSEEMLEIRQLVSSSTKGSSLLALEQFARSFRKLRNEVEHSTEPVAPWIHLWIAQNWEALRGVENIGSVPEGMGRLNILEKVKNALKLITVDGPPGSGIVRRHKILSRLIELLDREIDRILSEVRLIPSLDRSTIVAGEQTTINIALKNASSIAIRNFGCRVLQSGFKAETSVSYFAEGQIVELPLLVPPRDEARLDLLLVWSAERLDGRSIDGMIPLSLDVKKRDATSELREDLVSNPYITGTPVNRPEMFFGREGIISSIKRHLSNPSHANVILLEGNRRSGKSSILVQLERLGELPDWVTVRCDFQGASGHPTLPGIPTDHIFSYLARNIAEAGLRYGYHFWPPDQPNPDPKKPYRLEFQRALSAALLSAPAFDVLRDFLNIVLETIKPRRLLLMLDEFDRIQEGIDSHVTSPQVPQNIRYLLNNYPAISAILTGSRRMTQMRREYWSVLFGLGNRISVTAIDRSEAAKLVTEPVKGQLVFPPAVVDRVVDLCARQPYLVQQLCSRIVDACARSQQRTVTLEMVEEAATELVDGMEHFAAFWDFVKDERSRFILCILHRLAHRESQTSVTLPMIEDELEQAGVQATREELIGDELKKLIELELVAMEKEGRYCLAVPLLSLWISRNIDYEDQRERAQRESLARSYK